MYGAQSVKFICVLATGTLRLTDLNLETVGTYGIILWNIGNEISIILKNIF